MEIISKIIGRQKKDGTRLVMSHTVFIRLTAGVDNISLQYLLPVSLSRFAENWNHFLASKRNCVSLV